MALAKERHNPNDSQIFTFFDNVIGSDHDFEQGDSSAKSGGSGGGGDSTKNFGISRSSSTISSPNSLNSSGGLSHRGALNNYHDQPEDGHSTISFKPGFDDFMMNPNGSCNYLRFEQSDEQQPYSGLEYHPSDQNSGSISNVRLLENFNSIQTSSMYNPSTSCSVQENDHGEMELFGWPNPQQEPAVGDVATQESTLHKRPHTGESMQANKKQCNSSTKKGKPKSTQVQATKDPQSIAAKNRRERISERLKVLQDLVPNGSKVDLVTMLEKAISYVKFLQLQVKVLATDEFWPVQGGKAPELSQVKEAIDAILSSSQKERHPTSTVK